MQGTCNAQNTVRFRMGEPLEFKTHKLELIDFINKCMEYYTVYKITNQIDGKIYIGCHKTRDLDDTYMGSGKYLKYAQNKYGIENFEKEILKVFDNPEDMFALEEKIVNEEFLATENTYNLTKGGSGGNRITDHSEHYLKHKENRDKGLMHGRNKKGYTNLTREHMQRGWDAIKKKHPNGFFDGCKHSEESKKKIGLKNSVHMKGKGNSQFGTMWITNEVGSRKIKKDESIPDGWRKGRTLL